MALTSEHVAGQAVFMSPSQMKSDSILAVFRHPQNGFVENGSIHDPSQNMISFHYIRDKDAATRDYAYVTLVDKDRNGFEFNDVTSGNLTLGHCWNKYECPEPTDVTQFVNNSYDAVREGHMKPYGWRRAYTDGYLNKKSLPDITTPEAAQSRVLKALFEPE